MMSRLKSGLSRERWWRGWGSEPEPCQVCIHTQHVSEWAFYITLNLDQMADTQWARAHGYCWASWYVHASLCVRVHAFKLGVCVYVFFILFASVCVRAVACKLCASLFISVRALVFVRVSARVRMSASLWRCGRWTLYFCVDSMPSSPPVSHSVVSSSSQQQACSQLRSLLNTKCTFPA